MKDFFKGLTLVCVGLGALYVMMFGPQGSGLGAVIIVGIVGHAVMNWQ